MKFLTVDEYKRFLLSSIHSIDASIIEEITQSILLARSMGKFIFIVGNGGSAASASHLATDLMFGSKLDMPPIKAVSLVDSTPSITATGNDINFDHVFARQLKNLGSKGDLLFLISASGNSPNILACLEISQRIGMKTIGFSGFDGGVLAKQVDISLHIPTELGCYGVVEDTHMIVGHMITELLKVQSAKENING